MFMMFAVLIGCRGDAAAPKADDAHADHKEGDGHDKDAKDKDAKDGDHGHDHGGDNAMEMKQPPEGAKVMFGNIEDGAELSSPVKVEMQVEGMKVQPAGELVEGTGHHHLVIDSDPVPFGTAVPADETHIHFGKGQTEAEVELKPGEHTLMLQFADGAHRSYGEQLSAQVKITVK